MPEAGMMKCNACWKNLEGRAVATTCGHIFCILIVAGRYWNDVKDVAVPSRSLFESLIAVTTGTEDAQKILSSVDATCPLCEQMLSKR
jgi:E3 ubiquitin-protein ligase CCNP1IP1